MERTFTITIRTAEIPDSIHGITATKGNEHYHIFITGKDPEPRQAAAFLHECLHIYHNDLSRQINVNQIEQERHAELITLLELLKQESEQG